MGSYYFWKQYKYMYTFFETIVLSVNFKRTLLSQVTAVYINRHIITLLGCTLFKAVIRPPLKANFIKNLSKCNKGHGATNNEKSSIT